MECVEQLTWSNSLCINFNRITQENVIYIMKILLEIIIIIVVFYD